MAVSKFVLAIGLSWVQVLLITARPLRPPSASMIRCHITSVYSNEHGCAGDSQQITLWKRSQTDDMAAAIAGTVIAAGVFVLVLLFLALHYNKHRLLQLLGKKKAQQSASGVSRRDHAYKLYGQDVRMPRMVDSSLPKHQVEEHFARAKHNIEDAMGVLKTVMTRRSTNLSDAMFLSGVAATTAGTCQSFTTSRNLSTEPRVPERVVAKGDSRRIGPRKQPPASLTPLDTTMRSNSMVVGSCPDGIYDAHPIESQRPDSRWSLSTLGRELLSDTMHDPEPQRYAVSPETPLRRSQSIKFGRQSKDQFRPRPSLWDQNPDHLLSAGTSWGSIWTIEEGMA